MNNLNRNSWPVLVISNDVDQSKDSSSWLEEINSLLKSSENCSTIFSSSCNDVYNIISSEENPGAILIDKDLILEELSKENRDGLSLFAPELDIKRNLTDSEALLNIIRAHNSNIPVLLMTPRCPFDDISYGILENINGISGNLRTLLNPLQGIFMNM